MTITRRTFLSQSAALGALAPALSLRQKSNRAYLASLLLADRSTSAISPIHRECAGAMLAKQLPEAEVRLWASPDLSDEVMAMEHRRFPKLQIVKGAIGA